MHKISFYNKFIICLYMFRALCANHQEVKIILYSIWYHHTLQVAVWCSRWREDNFELLMMSTQCSKHVEAYNKLIIKKYFVL